MLLPTRDLYSSRGPIANKSHEKILVVQTSFLGDAILTTPLLAELRRRFPKAELAVLCTPQARSLLKENPDIDRIITDDKKGTEKGWSGLWRKAREIRSYGFNTAISPHKSFRTALLLFLASIPYRVGFRQSVGWFFYHDRVNRDASLHDVDRNISLLEPLGIRPAECQRILRVEVSRHSQREVESLFASLGIQENGKVFGIHPGSVWPTKRWSPEGYAKLMFQLKRKYSCQILLFGGSEDQKIISRLQQLSGHLGVSVAGKIGLDELPCAISRCSVFITNDSGPMHIAVARGVPVVAVFCATTPSLGFYPYSSKAVVVEKDLPCRPCSSHGGRRCPLGTEDCIRLIQADHVLQGVEKVLEASVETSLPGHAYEPQWIRI